MSTEIPTLERRLKIAEDKVEEWKGYGISRMIEISKLETENKKLRRHICDICMADHACEECEYYGEEE